MLRYPLNRRARKSKPRQQRQDQPLTLESLESRQMLSADGLLGSTLVAQTAFANLNTPVITQPLTAPSASAFNPETGITITSVGNLDGSRTVTQTNANGDVISTTNIPASTPPSASTTDPNTGNTITATGNPDGSQTVTETTPTGNTVSTTNVPTSSPDSASSTDPSTGVTTTSTSNPDGSRTVTETDANGDVTSTTDVPASTPPSASTTDPDTGNTITSSGNPDGSTTITTTTPDGQTTSTTNTPSTGTSASSTDPSTGITTTSTSNPDGTRTVTQTNAEGDVISTTTKGTPKPQPTQDQPQGPKITMLVYDIETGNDYPVFEGDFDPNGGLFGDGGTQSDTTDDTAPDGPTEPAGDDNEPVDSPSDTAPDTPQDPTPPASTSPGQTEDTDSQAQNSNSESNSNSQSTGGPSLNGPAAATAVTQGIGLLPDIADARAAQLGEELAGTSKLANLSDTVKTGAKVVGAAGNIIGGVVEYTQSAGTTKADKIADAVGVAGVGFAPGVGINQAIGGTVDTVLALTGIDDNAGVGDVIGASNVVRITRAGLSDTIGLITGDPTAGRELNALNHAFQSGKFGTVTQGISQAGDYVGEVAADTVIGGLQWLGVIDDPSVAPEIPQNTPTISPEDIGPIPEDVPDGGLT